MDVLKALQQLTSLQGFFASSIVGNPCPQATMFLEYKDPYEVCYTWLEAALIYKS